jgi:hypothetical protein
MFARQLLAVEKTRINRIIDEDFCLTRLVCACIAAASFWLDF